MLSYVIALHFADGIKRFIGGYMRCMNYINGRKLLLTLILSRDDSDLIFAIQRHIDNLLREKHFKYFLAWFFTKTVVNICY